MVKDSFINQLIEFNSRVLDQGSVQPDKNYYGYTMKELKRLLFFNRVFISNMDEMFRKYEYNISEFSMSYVAMLKKYTANIFWIQYHMTKIDPSIVFNTESTFESRLRTDMMIKDQIMTTTYSKRDIEDYQLHYEFEDGKIYYISYCELSQYNYISVSFVDPRRSAYSIILKYYQDNSIVYMHNVEAITDYIQRKIDTQYRYGRTIAVKVTTNGDTGRYSVKKVECSGNVDDDMQNTLKKLFPKSTLIVRNKYIYTDDIERIIDSKIPVVPVVKQQYRPIVFNDIFNKDRLVEYPKDSFDEYLDLLNSAAEDDTVGRISVTLYRIGSDPSIYYILRKAIQNGIQVHVNIELRASGEDINYLWRDELQRIGVDVTSYSIAGKVHSKLTLIEFKNGNCIAQIGTGNYHTKTTSQYTDLSLITADENICDQIKKLFLIFDGFNYDDMYEFTNDLLVTGYNLRNELKMLIEKEASKGQRGYISFKCNTLDDDKIIRLLDDAADKGCKIDLIVRGVCTWIPDQLGKNVTIKSIVWDKLEHSRVYCFGATNPVIYIGSLDPVARKIDGRVETLVLIKDPDVAVKICNYMTKYITNTKNSWIQTSTGLYIKEG